MWDGVSYGEVEADTKLKNKLCGLCGNFNDDHTDELTLREGQLAFYLRTLIMPSRHQSSLSLSAKNMGSCLFLRGVSEWVPVPFA